VEQGPQQDPMAAAGNVGGRSEGERRERTVGAADVRKTKLKQRKFSGPDVSPRSTDVDAVVVSW
jgi:hypothetical protein